jgi:hypothetical protein
MGGVFFTDGNGRDKIYRSEGAGECVLSSFYPVERGSENYKFPRQKENDT